MMIVILPQLNETCHHKFSQLVYYIKSIDVQTRHRSNTNNMERRLI